MPGTTLEEAEHRALLDYLKQLSPALAAAPAGSVGAPGSNGGHPTGAAAIERGRALYSRLNCDMCHGPKGRGDGALAQGLTDDTRAPIRVRDLTAGHFKGGASARDIYVRLSTGMDGTPMKAVRASETDRWLLAQYVASLADEGDGATTDTSRRPASRSAVVSRPLSLANAAMDPLAAVWDGAPATQVPLFALWDHGRDRGQLFVRSLHDEQAIHFRLEWNDSTKSDLSADEHFPDGVAIQVFAGGEHAFVGMGDAQNPVLIWHWKADWQRQADARSALGPLHVSNRTETYPAPELPRAKTEIPRLARGRVNPVHEGVARGPGTFTERSNGDQIATGRGVFSQGRWYVVISRSAEPDVDLSVVERAQLAFAVWDGASRDRASQKAITSWYPLVFEGR